MKSCLIKAHEAGLGSLINNFVLWAHEYGHVAADWSNSLYSDDGNNLWNVLFLPLPSPTEPFDTRCVYPESADRPTAWLTWRWAAMLYRGENPEHLDWRENCHEKWERYFIAVPPCTDFVQRFVDEFMPTEKKIVAAQVRWHGHSGEQIYPHKSQSLEQYAAAIEQEKPDLVYVASGDQHSLDWLAARFPVICHPTSRRSPTRDTDFHRTEKQTPADARHVLEEIMLMALCDGLVHPVSNLATVALYCNPTLKSVYLP